MVLKVKQSVDSGLSQALNGDIKIDRKPLPPKKRKVKK